MLNMKSPFAAALAAVAALCAGSAQAGGVNWSVSVNLPPVATVVSNGHGYHAQPVYYEPAPVYYEPVPVYVRPRPVYVQPAPVYYQPRPVVVYRPGVDVVGGRFAVRHHWHHRDRHDRHEERRHRREHRDEYGDRRDFGNHR